MRKTILVWDFRVRISHALVGLLFAGAFGLAALAPERSAPFALHAALGLVALFVVALRVVWGIVGPPTARRFDLRPSALLAHLKGESRQVAGHNPGTSWFALAMAACLVLLGLTGFLLGRGDERAEEAHEILAWTAAGLVLLHLAGLVLHRLLHGENLAVSMVTGRRAGDPAHAIRSARPLAGAALLLLTAAWGAAVIGGSDLAAGRVAVPVAGARLTIGEREKDAHEQGREGGEREDDDEREGERR